MASWQPRAEQQLASTAESRGVVESKYLFLALHTRLLLSCLHRMLVPDPRYPFGNIFSVYFDTPDLASYREARRGLARRAKVRLRWYEDAATLPPDRPVPCYLEIKRKEQALRYKRREPLTLTAGVLASEPLRGLELAELGKGAARYFAAPVRALAPVMVIEYERHRFVDPGSGRRIALDHGIRCPAARQGTFPAVRPLRLRPGVLEVKGSSAGLPGRLGPVRGFLTRRSYSKYGRCCRSLLDPVWSAGS